MSYFNIPALVAVLRRIKDNPRLMGPNEVANICGVAAAALEQEAPKIDAATFEESGCRLQTHCRNPTQCEITGKCLYPFYRQPDAAGDR